uniref:ubiquitinyl hydrolase 1 n=2 Tax=Bicosoecida sp. CB-2014 TaxID=1486930 RepID=A0A7S1C6A7_9STRA
MAAVAAGGPVPALPFPVATGAPAPSTLPPSGEATRRSKARRDLVAPLYHFTSLMEEDLGQQNSSTACARMVADWLKSDASLLASEAVAGADAGDALSLRQQLRMAQEVLSGQCPTVTIKWYGPYGAAIVCTTTPCPAAGGEGHDMPRCGWCSRRFDLLALDSWRATTFTGANMPAPVPTAVCDGHRMVPLQDRCRTPLPEVYVKVKTLLDEAAAATSGNKGARRSQPGQYGHQKTPGFLWAIAFDAIAHDMEWVGKTDSKTTEDRTMPIGGFTDVGLHTGGVPRPTSWPLAFEALRFVLSLGTTPSLTNPALFARIRCYFDVWVAEQLLPAPCDAVVVDDVNDVMRTIDAATRRLCEGHLSDADCRALSERIVRIRESLDSAVDAALRSTSDAVSLPPDLDMATFRDVRATLPDTLASPDIPSLDKLRGIALTNLQSAPSAPLHTLGTAASMLTDAVIDEWHVWSARVLWIRPGTKSLPDQAVQYFLRNFERFIFSIVPGEDDLCGGLTEDGSQTLLDLVNKHHKFAMHGTLPRVRAKAEDGRLQKGQWMMDVVVRSRHALVAWSAFCVVHASAAANYDDLRRGSDFGLALNVADLRHLTLDDHGAVLAQARVSRYLVAHSNSCHRLFHPGDMDTTARFAELVAASDEKLADFVTTAKRSARERVDGHWKRVEDQKLQWQAADAAAKQAERAWRECPHRGPCDHHSNYQRTKSRADKLASPPWMLHQPLPESRAAMHVIMFFLWPPQRLAALMRATFMAQGCLLPVAEEGSTESWLDHAQSCVEMTKYGGIADRQWSKFAPHSTKSRLKLTHDRFHCAENPRHITDMTDKERDGVWYPPGSYSLAWEPECKRCGFDGDHPFGSVDPASAINLFTSRVGDEFRKLQDAMALSETSVSGKIDGWGSFRRYDRTTRGNMPYAQVSDPLPGTSSVAQLSFSGLRAEPLLQLRKLCVALRRRALPFESRDVAILLRQALYHIGPSNCSAVGHGGAGGDGDEGSRSDRIDLAWKRELEDGGDVPATLLGELSALANELSHKPREVSALLLLGQCAAYIAEWHVDGAAVVRQFASVAYDRAQEVEVVDGDADGNVACERKYRLLAYAVLVLACGDKRVLSSDDVELLVKMIVSLHCVGTVETEQQEATVKDLGTAIRSVMARRADDLADKAEGAQHILTNAVRHAFSGMTVSDSLRWVRMRDDKDADSTTVCFEAEDTSGDEAHLWNVNLLNGVVLYDGEPHKRLGVSITSHELYKRTFGDFDFAVVAAGSRWLRTIRKVNDHFAYKFRISDGQLHVREIDLARSRDDDPTCEYELELLDHNWCPDLPVRLRELHGHWLDRRSRRVVLRGVRFSDREERHVVEVGVSGVPTIVCRSPLALKRWGAGRLVLAADERARLLLKVLGKFERPETIHVYATEDTPATLAIVHLPRYELALQLMPTGELVCMDHHKGFRVAERQMLCDTLMGFHGYLVLQHANHPTRIVMPAGHVVATGDRGVTAARATIKVSAEPGAKLRAHAYDEHSQFHEFLSKDVEARLQLAAVFATISTLLPMERLRCTGAERALELVRRSSLDRPATNHEAEHLDTIVEVSGATPSVALAAHLLRRRAHVPSFLYPRSDDDARSKHADDFLATHASGGDHMDADTLLAKAAYCEQRVHGCGRWTLNAGDERTLGIVGHKFEHTVVNRLDVMQVRTAHDSHAAVGAACVNELEKLLIDVESAAALVPRVRDLIDREYEVIQQDLELPTYMLQAQLACNQLSQPRQLDVAMALLPTAYGHSSPLRALNPSLSDAALERMRPHVLSWASLCVFAGKLQRLQAASADDRPFIWEKERHARTWTIDERPEWLLFEVWSELQIRPAQHQVAAQLLATIECGHQSATQLNMGEGKTRVIVPMLLLTIGALQEPSAKRLKRVIVPASLLGELKGVYHHSLAASPMHMRVMGMPFDREVRLDAHAAARLHDAVDELRTDGGALLVTAQQLLSLRLKSAEGALIDIDRERAVDEATTAAEARVPPVAAIVSAILAMEGVDIIDECDEVLEPTRQLVYAIGTSTTLDALVSRYNVARALLAVVSQSALREDVECVVLRRRRRYVDSVVLVKSTDGKLASHVLEKVIASPPHELRWLKHWWRANGAKEETIRAFLLDRTQPAVGGFLEALKSDRRHDLLALRGFLAFGYLERALRKRHRIDYGVDRTSRRLKRIAIPFRACDTPKSRSEFQHPDLGLMLTLLAYEDDGLSHDEVGEAVRILLTRVDGVEQQRSIYRGWFEAASKSEAVRTTPWCGTHLGSVLESIDALEKIDPSNRAQAALLTAVYKDCPLTTAFWLQQCVFPQETRQFPKQIAGTPWNLVENPATVGFSGTRDTDALYPQPLRQLQEVHAARGTDDLMRSLLLKHASIVRLPTEADGESARLPMWKQLLNFVSTLACDPGAKHGGRVSALIDAGALLVGVSPPDAAEYLLSEDRLPTEKPGVLFYRAGSRSGMPGESDGWFVRDRHGTETPRTTSALDEQSLFAVFDEYRCRGADVRLPSDAVAVLTVARNTRRDTLMQAAGRLRKFGSDQRILLVCTPDAEVSIREGSLLRSGAEMTVDHIVSWSNANVRRLIKHAMPLWVRQAAHHARTQRRLDRLPEDVSSTLSELYKEPDAPVSLMGLAVSERDRLLADVRDSDDDVGELRKKLDAMCDAVADVAGDDEGGAAVDVLDTECERELEQEEEVEEERQVERARKVPAAHLEWSYASALVTDESGGPAAAFLESLVEFSHAFKAVVVDKRMGDIGWPTSIFCTRNFFATVAAQPDVPDSSGGDANLRVIDAFLLYGSGATVLLTDTEAEHVLTAILDHVGASDEASDVRLTHLSCEAAANDKEGAPAPAPLSRSRSITSPTLRASPEHLAAFLLFNAETRLTSSPHGITDGVEGAVEAMLRDASVTSDAVAALMRARAQSAAYERSDLQAIVERVYPA